MFQVLPWHIDLILGLLTIQKCDLVEVETAMFQGIALHFALIFGLWTSTK